MYYTVEELVIPSGRSLCHLDRFSTHTPFSLFGLFCYIQIFSLLHLLFLYLFLSLQNSDMVPLIYGLFSIKKVPVMTYSLLFLYPANEAFWWEKRHRKYERKRHREKRHKKGCKKAHWMVRSWMVPCGSLWFLMISFVTWLLLLLKHSLRSFIKLFFDGGLLCEFIWNFWKTFLNIFLHS